VGAVYKALDAHVRARGLGEVLLSPLDVILSDITIVQPDVVYLERSRAGAVSSRGIEGAPTLAVEILSPWTAAIDRQRKRQLYARYGVPFYWIVDADARAVEAQALGPEGYVQVGRLAGEERTARFLLAQSSQVAPTTRRPLARAAVASAMSWVAITRSAPASSRHASALAR